MLGHTNTFRVFREDGVEILELGGFCYVSLGRKRQGAGAIEWTVQHGGRWNGRQCGCHRPLALEISVAGKHCSLRRDSRT